MAISAQMVKELREQTGAGMMDCKKALVEVNGDMEKAVDWLRQKGIAKAAKKSGRATCEGLVSSAFSVDGKNVAMASLMCETDFVAKGDAFKEMSKKVAEAVLEHNPESAEALDGVVGNEVKQLIANIGENMQLGKFARHTTKANEAIGHYIHNNGKIGVLVFLELGEPEDVDKPEVKALAKELAMQVAAGNPMALDPSNLDPAAIAREREVYRQKAIEEGKPEKIIDKIVDGAVKKFEKEVCLLNQPYMRDDKISVSDLIAKTAKEINDTIKVTGFERIQLSSD